MKDHPDRPFRLVPLRLAGGVWEGLWEGPEAPRLRATHEGRELPGLAVEEAERGWTVRLPLPADLIAEGVQTVVIADAATGATEATVALVAGEALAGDLRAEIDLLRAELDMLKRAFRRHCLETGTGG
jgi:hypothetical protein